MFSSVRARRPGTACRILVWLFPVLAIARDIPVQAERYAAAPGQPPLTVGEVAWAGPRASEDSTRVSRWRAAVGPAIVRPVPLVSTSSDTLTVVTWNTNIGAGDLRGMLEALPRSAPIVFLLQEVYRDGPDVPVAVPPGAAFARRKGGRGGGDRSLPVEQLARDLGLSLFYAPSMRNGGSGSSSEDRGSAILSTLPLERPAALELPLERQRRVVVAATVRGRTASGSPWQLRVVNAHLDNSFRPWRLSLAAEYGRTRQARALLAWIADTCGDEPVVLGGDFNTWSGFADEAYRTLARAFPAVRPTDRRPTFMGLLRLDHLFFRLPPGWSAAFARGANRYGSDHHPLIGTVRLAPTPPP